RRRFQRGIEDGALDDMLENRPDGRRCAESLQTGERNHPGFKFACFYDASKVVVEFLIGIDVRQFCDDRSVWVRSVDGFVASSTVVREERFAFVAQINVNRAKRF